MSTLNIKKGAILVALPSSEPEVLFSRSVILLADHNSEGSVGFILNKPMKYVIEDLVPSIESDFQIYNGGPVGQDNLYFIHNVPNIIPESIAIADGIFWGGNFEIAKSLINNKKISANNIKFFLGYSGWDANQLKMELLAKSWIITENIENKDVISKNHPHLWKEKMLELGGEFLIWGNAPEDLHLN